MEKLSFLDLIIIAKSISPNFDALIRQDENGSLFNRSGVCVGRRSDGSSWDAEDSSDDAYDKISCLVEVLKGILEYRPLPF